MYFKLNFLSEFAIEMDILKNSSYGYTAFESLGQINYSSVVN